MPGGARARTRLLSALAGTALLACAEPPPPAPAPPSAAARAVRIESTPPGASAGVSGQGCATPCTLRLEPGRYRLVLRKTGYLPYETEITVGFAGETRVNASLLASH